MSIQQKSFQHEHATLELSCRVSRPVIGSFLDSVRFSDSPEYYQHDSAPPDLEPKLDTEIDVQDGSLSSSLHEPQIGTFLGDFQVVRCIGRGSTSTVFLAEHRETHQQMALKVFASKDLVDAEDKKRFVLEAETGSWLDHPHVASIRDVGFAQGFHYMVMEYVEGVTLAQLLDDQLLEVETTVKVVLSIAEILSYVHQRGIVHRDIKPANILVDRKGQPWLTDFGVAKSIFEQEWSTSTGMLIGTPSYMAPEQISGTQEWLGPASDLYALGVVLYEMLTGRLPFRSARPFDTLQLALYTQPTPLRRIRSQIPASLEAICLKCLAKHPHERYATADELIEELESFLKHQPVKAQKEPVKRASLLSDPWKGEAYVRDPELLAQWSRIWRNSALGIVVLGCVISLLRLSGWMTPMVEWGVHIGSCLGLCVWVGFQRLYRSKPITRLEWQVTRLWLLFGSGVVGLFVFGFQMGWVWSELQPLLFLLGVMGFGSMALFVDHTFMWISVLCLLLFLSTLFVYALPAVLSCLLLALGLLIPARKYIEKHA